MIAAPVQALAQPARLAQLDGRAGRITGNGSADYPQEILVADDAYPSRAAAGSESLEAGVAFATLT